MFYAEVRTKDDSFIVLLRILWTKNRMIAPAFRDMWSLVMFFLNCPGSCNFENFKNITRAHTSRNALAFMSFSLLIVTQITKICICIWNYFLVAGLAWWWEHLPSTNVAQVSISALGIKINVDWVCWFSILCYERFFPGYSGFPLSPKTNIIICRFDFL